MTAIPADVAALAKLIDHSLLRPELTEADVRTGCEVAARRQVASVCVRPADVSLAVACLHGSGVPVGTVISFPHGCSTTEIKVAETVRALADGAAEFDMVVNIGCLRAGDDQRVADDIAAVVKAAEGHTVKVILENAYLTDDEKIRGCRLAEDAGAHFVKTSTGYAPSGATLDDVRLMRATVSPSVGVKAAGGIRTLDVFLAMVDAGATRIGATATEAILDAAAVRG